MTEKPIYAPNYKIVGNCLLEIRNSKQGPYDRKLCNFLPWIVSEITLDDGAETTTRIRLRGIHESGRDLPEIEIPADDLGNFNWIAKHWGMDCILEVGRSVKDSVRYAIQTTAKNASRQTVYAVTGWKKVNGAWEYLLPGSDAITVSLPGKLGGYRMERECTYPDILVVEAMLRQRIAPPEVQLPLLAFVFLSPLNEFLRQAGCVPKFVLFLVGKTGSRKSTLAALMLSFFGRFTASELPLSFRDTGNSIIRCHGRVPEMVAWLEIGMRMLLMFLLDKQAIPKERSDTLYDSYQQMLYTLARKQADSIVEDKPAYKFLRKLYALLESGQACLLKRDCRCEFIPNSFVGYEDEDYLYLNKDIAHKLVKKLCEEQGESFSISARGLLSALVEEGIAEPGRDQNTKPLRVGEKNIRLMWVKKSAAWRIVDGG